MRKGNLPAAWAAYLLGALHVAAPLVSNDTPAARGVALVGAIWILLGLALARSRGRIVQWLAWAVALAGLVLVAGMLGDPAGLEPRLVAAMADVNLALALILFVGLWRDRPADGGAGRRRRGARSGG